MLPSIPEKGSYHQTVGSNTYQQGLVEYGQGIEESVHYVQLMKDFSALQASPRRVRELEGKVAEEQKIARP